MRCIALLSPINFGRKKDEAASIIIPRLAKTNPILAFSLTMRMFIGSVMVIPTPTALPFMAAMTGFVQRWIARVTFPPSSL